MRVLKDPATFSSMYSTVPKMSVPNMLIPLNYDPPDHTAYRNAFAPWFSPAAVSAVEPAARERLQALITTWVDAGGGDFIAPLAVPFPCVTFLLMLGLPIADLDRLLAWKDNMVRDLLSNDPELMAKVETIHFPALMEYFRNAIEVRESLQDRPDDVLTKLVEAKVGGRDMTTDEKIQTLNLLFQAGLDTVTGTLSFAFDFLARDPDLVSQIVADPTIVPAAVEELLRRTAIVCLARIAMADAVVGGQHVRAGEMVMLPGLAASLDDGQYPDAERIDFHRPSIRHVALGGGPHRCLGSHLARMELRVFLEEFVAQVPRFTLDEAAASPPRYGVVSGIDYLPLVIG
jgi:cytochrome P450